METSTPLSPPKSATFSSQGSGSQQTSIICDGFLPLMDESALKRNESQAEMSAESAVKKKKRRSSMATKRRSITEGLPKPSVESPTPNSAGSENSQESQQTEDERVLQPNPANIKVNEEIAHMTAITEKLNEESKRWKEIYKEWKDKAKESEKLLSTKPTIPVSELSQRVIDMANSEYLSQPMLDLSEVRLEVNTILRHLDMDREFVARDIRTITETEAALRRRNEFTAVRNAAAKQRQTDRDLGLQDLHLGDSSCPSRDPRDLITGLLQHWDDED